MTTTLPPAGPTRPDDAALINGRHKANCHYRFDVVTMACPAARDRDRRSECDADVEAVISGKEQRRADRHSAFNNQSAPVFNDDVGIVSQVRSLIILGV
jgi:hypothetical protein